VLALQLNDEGMLVFLAIVAVVVTPLLIVVFLFALRRKD
jgi:hypothetical protein